MNGRGKVNDFLWYGRLGIWLGAAVLLIQSILGRSAGPTTAIGALIVTAGLIAFLAGLAIGDREVVETEEPSPEELNGGGP